MMNMGQIMAAFLFVVVIFLFIGFLPSQGTKTKNLVNDSLNFSAAVPNESISGSESYRDKIGVPDKVIDYFYRFSLYAFSNASFKEVDWKNRNGEFVCIPPPPKVDDYGRYAFRIQQNGEDVDMAIVDYNNGNIHYLDSLYPNKDFVHLNDKKVYIIPKDYYNNKAYENDAFGRGNHRYDEGSKYVKSMLLRAVRVNENSDLSPVEFDRDLGSDNKLSQIQDNAIKRLKKNIEHLEMIDKMKGVDFVLHKKGRFNPGFIDFDGVFIRGRDNIYVGRYNCGSYERDGFLLFKTSTKDNEKVVAFILTSKVNGYKTRHFEKDIDNSVHNEGKPILHRKFDFGEFKYGSILLSVLDDKNLDEFEDDVFGGGGNAGGSKDDGG